MSLVALHNVILEAPETTPRSGEAGLVADATAWTSGWN